jgi:preprotein translocase subunit SecD
MRSFFRGLGISVAFCIVFLIGLKLTYFVKDYLFMAEERRSLEKVGGAEFTLQFDMRDIPEGERAQTFKDAQEMISRRFRFIGFYPFSKTLSGYKMSVELAHVSKLDMLTELFTQTPQLTFWNGDSQSATLAATPRDIAKVLSHPHKTELGGRDLREATVERGSDGTPQVRLSFTDEGAKKLAHITQQNIGKLMVVAIDDKVIDTPRVREVVNTGELLLTGLLTEDQAKTIQIEINAGAFPVPVSVVEKHYIKRSSSNQD